MSIITSSTRRNFLKISGVTAGGLFLGFNWADADAGGFNALSPEKVLSGDISFNSYLSISPEGVITIFSPNPEVGQNIKTSFPMIVAEELDADWTRVKVLQAVLDKKYERQLTGGSGAIPHSWERLRKAGATARHMLVEAAAKRWSVPSASLTTNKGMVMHKETGRTIGYGDLATEAASIAIPSDVRLKDRKDFKLIGTAVRNVDNADIITGKPLFGIDFYREGMLFAMIQRPVSFGMKLKSVDTSAAKAQPGIVDVVTFKNNVAVVGKSTWAVNKARKLLKIEYETVSYTHLTLPTNREV